MPHPLSIISLIPLTEAVLGSYQTRDIIHPGIPSSGERISCEQHVRQASTYCHLDSIHGGVADCGEEETKAHPSQSLENNHPLSNM